MLPPTEKNVRNFGRVMSLVLAVLAVLVLWKSANEHRALIIAALLAAGALLLGLSAVAWRALILPFRAWMGLAHYLGLVMTFVLMTLFYFILLPPFTLIRLKDPLRLKMGGSTYWEPHRNAPPTVDRFRRPF